MKPLPDSFADLAAGGKAPLARTLSALENRLGEDDVARLLDGAAAAPRGMVLGLTGPPGVGKSTLVNAFVSRLRARGQTVAVIAVDPSSHRTGGAILGDRTRIETDPEDTGVFVRSMAARRQLGGLASITFPAVVLMRALFDVVIVETVGVGQSETAIVNCADLVVFCAQPGSGDALQFMKAGVVEVPDIILVTKGDMGAPARQAAADLKGALSLSEDTGSMPQVLVVSSTTGAGIDEALDTLTDLSSRLAATGRLDQKRQAQVGSWIEDRLRESYGEVGLILMEGRINPFDSPFRSVSDLSRRANEVVQKLVENLWNQ